MLSRNFILTCLFVVLLFAVHACSPNFAVEDETAERAEVQPQPEPDGPKSLPIELVQAPRPEPPKPQPASKPKTEPAKAKSQEAKTAKKQGGGKDKGGLNVVGRFDCSVEFYLDVMRREGARLLLYEKSGPAYYDIHEDGGVTALEGLSGAFAPVARNLTLDHPRSSSIIRRAEQRFGPGSYEVVLLIPVSVQERIDQMVAQVVPASVDASGSVTVRYENSGNRLLFAFEKAVLNGKVVALNQRLAF